MESALAPLVGSLQLAIQHQTRRPHTKLEESRMARKVMSWLMVVLFLCSFLLATFAAAAEVAPFDASRLVELGDNIRYGSYKIIKIGEGIYQINDPGVTTGKGGAWGVLRQWHTQRQVAG